IAGIMGGRVAEEIVFNDITSGAENDIQRATQMARRMVTQWGMSDKLGTVTMGHKEELVFLGRDLGEQRNYSEEVAALIDEEIRSIVDHGYQTAKTILTRQRGKMDAVVERLKVVETIDGKGVDAIIAAGGRAPERGAGAGCAGRAAREPTRLVPSPAVVPGAARACGVPRHHRRGRRDHARAAAPPRCARPPAWRAAQARDGPRARAVSRRGGVRVELPGRHCGRGGADAGPDRLEREGRDLGPAAARRRSGGQHPQTRRGQGPD